MPDLTRRDLAKLSAVAAVSAAGRAFSRFSGAQRLDDSLLSEFLMELTLRTETPHEVGAGSGLLVVPIVGGTFEGPRLRGTFVSPGGDWLAARPDGSRLPDVRALMQTDDGQAIYVSWRGVSYTLPGGSLVARITPMFQTASEKYTWLNNVVAVGVFTGAQHGITYRVYHIL